MNKVHYLCSLLILLALGCSGLRPKPVYTSSDPGQNPPNPPAESEEPVQVLPVSNYSGTLEDLERQRVMGEIEDLLGVPYRFGGNSKRGIDCSAFVQTVFKKALSLSLPRQAREMFAVGRPVASGELAFGDLVFFKDIEDKGTSHVGIYLDSGRFAHASVSQGVIISGMSESYYLKRYVGAKRVADP